FLGSTPPPKSGVMSSYLRSCVMYSTSMPLSFLRFRFCLIVALSTAGGVFVFDVPSSLFVLGSFLIVAALFHRLQLTVPHAHGGETETITAVRICANRIVVANTGHPHFLDPGFNIVAV